MTVLSLYKLTKVSFLDLTAISHEINGYIYQNLESLGGMTCIQIGITVYFNIYESILA